MKKPEMVVHTTRSDLRKTDIETLKDELRRNTPSAHISNATFQQVPHPYSELKRVLVFGA